MFVHGNNLEQKENHQTKYRDVDSRRYLGEIRTHYDQWKSANESLIGPTNEIHANDSTTLAERVRLLNEYKDFLDQQHYAEKFDSRSNLHSSVLEEFMFYLFRDLVDSISNNALIGKSHSFKDLFFRAPSYQEMLKTPLDTFAGAGGFSLGFKLAGANIIGAIEIDSWACETFKFNHPEATMKKLSFLKKLSFCRAVANNFPVKKLSFCLAVVA